MVYLFFGREKGQIELSVTFYIQHKTSFPVKNIPNTFMLVDFLDMKVEVCIEEAEI